MAAVPREVINAIHRVLSSIRLSLDAHSPAAPKRVSIEELRTVYLRFEEVRFLFRSRTGPLGRNAEESDLRELQDQVRLLVSDNQFMSIVDRIRHRPSLPRRDMEGYTFIHPGLSEGRVSVAEAMVFLLETLERLPFQLSFDVRETVPDEATESAITALSRLKRMIPKEQNVAPVRFDIVDHRLIVVPQPSNALAEDHRNIGVARNELTRQGTGIAEQLERSNCDRRLLDTFKNLQDKLASDSDVIRLGLANIACEVMCERFKCELPDAVSAMITAHTVGVGMYIAQFPEWQRFTEQAAAVELSSRDIPQISAAVDAVVNSLRGRPEIADPQVPRTLIALRHLIDDPREATKNAIFAVWRSLENLVIKIYSYGAEFLDKTITKAIDAGSTVAGKGLVIALMTAALGAGLAMTPVASHISQSAWISKASEVVKSQIEALAR